MAPTENLNNTPEFVQYLKNLLDDYFRKFHITRTAVYEQINDDVANFSQLRLSGTDVYQPLGAPSARGRLHTCRKHHSFNGIEAGKIHRCLERFDEDYNSYIDAENPEPFPEGHLYRPIFEELLGYFTAADSLKTISRFIAPGFAPLKSLPLTDVERKAMLRDDKHPAYLLGLEATFRKVWRRFLHFPGLISYSEEGEMNTERMNGLTGLYVISRLLLESEYYSAKLQESPQTDSDLYERLSTDKDYQRMLWIGDARVDIAKRLNQMASVAFLKLESRPGEEDVENLTKTQKMTNWDENMNDENLLALMDKMLANFRNSIKEVPLARLLLDLTQKEDDFERALADEHVEDQLINKQVVFLDEKAILALKNIPAEAWEIALLSEYKPVSDEPYIYKILKSISLLNRQRRNFRLLRDWAYQRPWRQIYQYYDTSAPGDKWMKSAIAEYNRHLDFSYRALDDEWSNDPATSLKRTAKKLFNFKPFNHTDFHSKNEALEKCKICQKDMGPANDFSGTIMELPCQSRHRFHMHCILADWDEEGRYLFSCPTCKASPSPAWMTLGLHSTDSSHRHSANLDSSFVLNVYGWREGVISTDPRIARKYDVPLTNPKSKWLAEENARAAALESLPVQWFGGTYDVVGPGERLNNLGLRTESRRVARTIGDRWHSMDYDRWGRAEEKLGNAKAWEIPMSRGAPSEEAAFLRRKRRRLDRERREDVAASGKGLTGLTGVV